MTNYEFTPEAALKQRGVSKIIREGSIKGGYTVLIVVNGKSMRFDIEKKWRKTMANFDNTADELNEKLDPLLREAIKIFLINTWDELKNGNGEESNTECKDGDARKESKVPDPERLTISQTMRKHSGIVSVNGIIISSLDLYQLVKVARWECFGCGYVMGGPLKKILEPPKKPKECNRCGGWGFEPKHEYLNAITIKIQDEVPPENNLDGLSVVLFEKDTEEIHVGEHAKIRGKIEKIQDRSGKYHTVVLAESVEYERRKKLVLTDLDILGIKRFAAKIPIHRDAYLSNYEGRLVSIFAPNIIGHEQKKLALILAMVGAPEFRDTEGSLIRGRINTLMLGPPGLAKSKFGREIVRARPNSRYVSGKNTTGKSLTAMVLYEEDKRVLCLGPAALSKNSVLLINEFDKLEPEEQDNILEVAEEGIISVNKFALLRTIDAPTTIVATANPKSNKWTEPDRVCLDEIPFSPLIVSRFDIVLIFRDTLDENENREYADRKTEYDERHIKHNYNFFQKIVEYARSINPTITEEARFVLNEFFVKLKRRPEFMFTNRTLESIYRMAKAFARINLTAVVDLKIAYKTIRFMNDMNGEFHCQIYHVPEVKFVAYDETIKVIEGLKGGRIDVIEAVKMACNYDDQVKTFIEKKGWEISRNKRLRNLRLRVLEHHNIQIMCSNPTVVRWVEQNRDEDSSGSEEGCAQTAENAREDYTPNSKHEKNQNDENACYDINIKEKSGDQKISKYESEICFDRAQRTQRTQSKTSVCLIADTNVPDTVFSCYYCHEYFASDAGRRNHRELQHPEKLDYPTAEDFKNRLSPNRRLGNDRASEKHSDDNSRGTT